MNRPQLAATRLLTVRSEEPRKLRWRICGTCQQGRDVVNGEWLRWTRESNGVGLRAFARHLKLSAAYISDIERGNRNVSPKILAAYVALQPRKP